jgi:hypothetical protein
MCPLSVDGRICHPGNEMVARRVVGVGALKPGESRKFTLRVEVLVPEPSAPAP